MRMTTNSKWLLNSEPRYPLSGCYSLLVCKMPAWLDGWVVDGSAGKLKFCPLDSDWLVEEMRIFQLTKS